MRRLICVLPVFGMIGCTPGMEAALQSAQQILKKGRTADEQQLDPRFAYLRVTRAGRVGLLWQGSTERNKDGVVEVYYGSGGEVLRLQNGRVVGVAGLPTEWRRVQFVQAPPWAALAEGAQPIAYQRVRDVMPGYRGGVRDELVVRAIEPPSGSALVGIEPDRVRWFEERVGGGGMSILSRAARYVGLSRTERLPPARYAVAVQATTPTVIYAEQCLSPDLCFTWQRWSVAMQASLRETERRTASE